MSASRAKGPSPRKIKRIEQESDGSDEEGREFDDETQQALEDIDMCQTEIEKVNEKSSEEILKVEQVFNKLRKPLFDKRNEMIQKIPNFWVTAMVNHPQISVLIDEDEEDCLHFLHKLEVSEFEDIKSGYRIKLFFDENPFFENDVLVKEFHLGTVGEPKSTSSEIQWKENMDLSKKRREVIALRRKRGLEPKTFFSWLNDHEDPSSDDIAEVVKDDLWLNPLQYYLAPDIESENGMDEEGSEEGEEDESGVEVEEEDEEQDQDEEDEEKIAAGAEDGEGVEEEALEAEEEA